MVKVITILSRKQLTPWKVKWKLSRKGADLDKKGNVAIKNGKVMKFLPLIDAWFSIEQLFNCKHPKYHLHDEKMKSSEKIKSILHENGIKATVKQITDKIHSLRNYFSAERLKEETASKKSGSGRDDFYTSKWLFSQPPSFLRNNLIPQVTGT